MFDLTLLEASFQEYSKNLPSWAPDGVVEIDLEILQRLDLLNVLDSEDPLPSLTRCFQIIESPNKITLVNDEFVVWIVPEMHNNEPITYTFIALNNPVFPTLELVFSTTGVYNTSRLVLRVLEKLLVEIHENEALIQAYQRLP
ncbi:MAG: hypothetical protein KDK78_01100 [Chlamydiia bacterium]|nr:hypothetical protein [Chlamydiia bacterium]